MIRSLLNPGLLWKEWRQNRWYFLLAGLLLLYVPVVKSLPWLISGGKSVYEWGNYLNDMIAFSQGRGTVLEPWGMAAVILLGALMLGEERKGSLNCLVSAPVSRSQIILAKFLTGAGLIILVMTVNVIYLTGMDSLFRLSYTGMDVLRWSMLTGLVFLGLYTLALMTSTFTANVLAAGGLSLGLIFLPRAVMFLITVTAGTYFSAGQAFLVKAYSLGNYLTLTEYLSRSSHESVARIDVHGSYISIGAISNGGIYPDIWRESLYLMLIIIVFLSLAMVIFERVSLEPGGTIFAGHGARRCCEITVTLLLGWGLALSLTASPVLFCLFVAGFSLVALALLELFYRISRYGSFLKPDFRLKRPTGSKGGPMSWK